MERSGWARGGIKTRYFWEGLTSKKERLSMATRRINAADGAEAVGAYVQALEVTDTTRRFSISGQAPVTADGKLPETFRGQAEAVWRNILAQLRAADMDAENFV